MLRPSFLLAPLLATACAVGPDYVPPEPAVPAAWSALETGGPSAASDGAADLSAWWRVFKDPSLAALVDAALAANLDLRGAAARVREARALRGAATGALLPEAGAGGAYERLRWSENGLFPADGEDVDHWQAGFDASWEIDVFGGRRRELEAARADLEASVEAMRDVRVSLAAELARTYVELRGAQARLAIGRRNLEAQRETAELVRARFDAGRIPELDLAQAEAQVSTTSSVLPSLEVAERRALHAIALLLARPPGAALPEIRGAAPIPAAPAEIPLGLPTDLLRRRPDLRRAERELAAATARVGAAVADLYPRFFLLGAFGVESLDASDLLTASSRRWSLGPSIDWPLFQGGRIRARIAAREAQTEQAALRFEQALLGALRDVEDALVAHAREQRRRAELARAEEAQRRAVELAQQRYAQGLTDFLAVLDAQRSLLAAQDALYRSEQAVASNAIALFKAVGGGWPAD